MAHTSERLCYCVEVFIVHNSKVLLRKHDKYRIWLSVGGHIDPGEDLQEAALREVHEEVGLTVALAGKERIHDGERELIVPHAIVRHPINDKLDHLVFVYFALATTDKLSLSEHEVTEECRWFSKEELSDPQFGIKPSILRYAKEALARLG